MRRKSRPSAAEQRETIATFRTVWPDGSVHWIEAKGRGQYAVDGTLQRITGTSMDITERKQAEEALRASEERFRKQYKGFPLPTYSWLQDGDDFVLQDFNDAAEASTTATSREWLGRRASERYADQPGASWRIFASVSREQRTIRRRERVSATPTHGCERDLAVSYVFVPPQTVMVHTEDITEAKQAEQQREAMAQSEKLRALGQMATGIAHDLNQSLMLVASYSDLARQALTEAAKPGRDRGPADDDHPGGPRRWRDGQAAAAVHASGARTGHPVGGPQQSGARRRAVDRAALARRGPGRRPAHQSAHRGGGPPTIQGSPAQLRELMTNLIFNAVDALPTGGTIRLRVVAEHGQGIIEVADSGVGMSAEVQERVFEPFFTTKGERGTGLGLAMVFGIVEQHGGRIEVRSAVGRGDDLPHRVPAGSKRVDSG